MHTNLQILFPLWPGKHLRKKENEKISAVERGQNVQ
jgi:hypothetical protein